MKFGVDIPQSHLDALESRAQRLTDEVDRATAASTDRRVREVGGQLVDRILEWIEEIKDLLEVGDEDVVERVRSFQARLVLAEKLVSRWPKPKEAVGTEPKKRRRKEPRAA